ncbi:MAG: class I adenylate-forming enzyme family protein [Acidimicrobiales bacterium]
MIGATLTRESAGVREGGAIVVHNMLISDFIRFAATQEPDAPALVFDGETTTFGELDRHVHQLANGLLEVAAPGERVAILAENIPEYVHAYYGVPLAGMVLTFLNYRLHPREIEKILANSGAEVLIVEPGYHEQLREIGATAALRQVLVTGDGPIPSDANTARYGDLISQAATGSPAVEVDDGTLAWLIYTSGTTGLPKGAMLSHRNLIAAVANSVMSWVRGTGPTITLTPWPLCHVAGYTVLVTHANKRPIVLMRGYEPEAYLSSIERYQITDTSVAPTMLSMLLRHPKIDHYDLDSVQRIGYGAAAMPLEVLKAGMARFPKAQFLTGFGMTELGGNVLYQSPEAHVRALAGESQLLASVGRPMPLGSVRVVDDQLEDVKPGEVGELVVRGPQVTMGYWDNPAATEEAFAGGWFHSGDLAKRDGEGNFYIVDRKKDMIVTGGENVYSREVEEVIYCHPGVAEAAVVGVPDDHWGEIIVAVIQLREGADPDPDGIVELCRENLAGYKKPRRVEFVGELPRNAAGKILKRDLRIRVGQPPA